jgi:SAM-dependent methyltransferase
MILAHQVLRFTGIVKTQDMHITVLDAGCGYAELYTLLHRARKARGSRIKYIGLDIDQDKKKIALELRRTVDYRIADVLDLGTFPESPYDVIVSGETIEHVDEEKGIKFLETMCDNLKPDGLLVMSFPTKMSETHRDNPFHVRLWDVEEIWDLAESFGMDVLDAFHLGVYKKNWPEQSDRIPVELMRTAMSALVGDVCEGPDAIFVARKW